MAAVRGREGGGVFAYLCMSELHQRWESDERQANKCTREGVTLRLNMSTYRSLRGYTFIPR